MQIMNISERFEDTAIDIVVIGSERWVRAHQIGAALGLVDPDRAVRKIVTRSQTEFDETTTIAIELPTAGGRQLVRLYNARGAALIAMKAQTAKGEDFRRWVLDVLEGKDDNTPVAAATNIPDGVLGSLRAQFLGMKGSSALVRYLAMGLGTSEIARLLGIRPSSVTSKRRVAEYLGLADAPGELAPHRLANFEKLRTARLQYLKAYREKQRLALPAPDATNGENSNG